MFHPRLGKQLFSLIIPGNVNVIRTHPDGKDDDPVKCWISPGDAKVLVKNGELLMGILCKKTLGAVAGSLVHVVFIELGHEVCARFIESIQAVINNWLLIEGHSVGIADSIAHPLIYLGIREVSAKAKQDVVDLIQDAISETIEPLPNIQTMEARIECVLSEACGRIVSSIDKSLSETSNSLKAMAVAGSAGSNINAAQIIGIVGQQTIGSRQQRIPFGFIQRRTLPHFVSGDFGPESRGFIENSFLAGLTPSEFFFHAMTGWESLVEESTKGAEIGSIQRRLVKAMESVMVQYDGTVRSPDGQLIQFCYGEDGLSADAAVEVQSIPTVLLDDGTFAEKFKFDVVASGEPRIRRIFNENVARDLLGDGDAFEMDAEWEQLCKDRQDLRDIFTQVDDKVVLPCNLQRIIWNAQNKFRIDQSAPTNLSPSRAIQGIRDLLDKCTLMAVGQSNPCATFFFQCLVRSTLCSKRLTEEFRLSSEAFGWLVGEIETRFRQAQVVPGEMVGALAAQSIGGSVGQLLHYASVDKKGIHALPRIKEILKLAKKSSSPSMMIYLTKDAANNNVDRFQVVKRRLEHVTLRQLVSRTAIHFDPDPRNTIIAEDQEFVNFHYDLMSADDYDPARISPWILRIELDRKKMMDKGLTIDQIAGKITTTFDANDYICSHSDNDNEKLVVRFRLKLNTDDNADDDSNPVEDDVLLRSDVESILLDTTLQGIKSIDKVFVLPKMTSSSGEIEAVDELVLKTDGSSLLKAMSERNVDSTRIITNEIREMEAVLGIEAAKKSVEAEMHAVLNFYDVYANARHLTLLGDIMAAKGCLMPLTSHEITRNMKVNCLLAIKRGL